MHQRVLLLPASFCIVIFFLLLGSGEGQYLCCIFCVIRTHLELTTLKETHIYTLQKVQHTHISVLSQSLAQLVLWVNLVSQRQKGCDSSEDRRKEALTSHRPGSRLPTGSGDRINFGKSSCLCFHSVWCLLTGDAMEDILWPSSALLTSSLL